MMGVKELVAALDTKMLQLRSPLPSAPFVLLFKHIQQDFYETFSRVGWSIDVT